jgi:hypothetical protein
MDFYASLWLSVGVMLGFMLGYTAHTVIIRWYLRKNMVNHPEFKIFMDVLDKNIPDGKKDESDTKD